MAEVCGPYNEEMYRSQTYSDECFISLSQCSLFMQCVCRELIVF